MTHIKRIPTAKLEVGMYISEQTDGLADGSIQTQGFIMRSDTLEKIKGKTQGDVFIDI